MNLEVLVSALLFIVPIATLVLIASRHRTMSLPMMLGLFSIGASAMMLGFAIFEDEPCTRFQLLARASTLGVGMLLMVWSMLRRRASDRSRHEDALDYR